MSHQGASGQGYVQTIVSSLVSTYREEKVGVSLGLKTNLPAPEKCLILSDIISVHNINQSHIQYMITMFVTRFSLQFISIALNNDFMNNDQVRTWSWVNYSLLSLIWQWIARKKIEMKLIGHATLSWNQCLTSATIILLSALFLLEKSCLDHFLPLQAKIYI